MKILLVTTKELTGLNYHRQFTPHAHLQDKYGKDVYEYSKCYSLKGLTDEEIASHDIVSFLRIAENPVHTDPTESIERVKKLGCTTILDIDDYWVLHPKHPQKETYEKNNYPQHAIAGLKAVDYVTTTTEHFADKIREYNKNVIVLPNSIDPNQSQFKVQETPNDRVRLGWIGGVFHAEDLKMVHNGFKEVWKGVNQSKFQFCLGGWNYPEKLSYVQHQIKNAPFEPSMLQYFKSMEYQLLLGKDVPNEYIFKTEFQNIPPYDLIEGYMTDFLKFPKDEQYKTFLMSKVADVTQGFDKPYRRLHGQTSDNYARLYNQIDVALIPLVENSFNSYKSQIKIIEAGYFKKAVVVSSVNPYLVDCNKGNSIQISPSKRGDGWGSAMKSLIFNKDKREDLAEAMHEHIIDNYLMDKVNKVRHQLYQSL